MNADQLRDLFRQPEGATLEFKREFYDLNNPVQQIKAQQRDEFIKDVLALANGSAATAGETAYLIIGADDHLQANGMRDLFDVAVSLPDQRTLLGYVNEACDPRIDTITLEAVVVDGVRLIVVTIPPTPHLHETRRPLKTKSPYTEHVVFYRENAGIKVANTRQREAILLLKRRRYADLHNAPPLMLGATIGAIVGGTVGDHYSRQPPSGGRLVQTIGGSLIGVIVGGSLGSSYRNLRRFWFEYSAEPLPIRLGLLATSGIFVLGFQSAVGWLFRRLRRIIPREAPTALDHLSS